MRKIYRFLRSLLIRKLYRLKNVDTSANILFGSKFCTDIIVGKKAFIADGARICPGVVIGKYTMLAPNVVIAGADHLFNKPGVPIIFSGRDNLKKTFINDDVWIGEGCFIRAGVKIGRGTVVAARSVVLEDLKSYSIYAGVPARFIRDRFSDSNQIAIHDEMLKKPDFHGNFCSKQEVINDK